MPPKKAAASDSPAEQEPIPVAEQKAAGVPPEETVTIAEQKAGADPPAAVAPETPLAVSMREGGGTGNESPALPASAVSGAARSHALLEHAQQALADGDPERAKALIGMVRDELDRYLPDQVKAAGVHEARHMVTERL
jgi:hypothetical protein